MSKKDDIQSAFKEAFIAKDDFAKTVLGGLKSAILYEEVAKGKKDSGLSDDEVISVVAKQVKQREDAAKLFTDGGAEDKAAKEIREKEVLAQFLPVQLSDEELAEKVREIGTEFDEIKKGQLIGAVKKSVGASADGARIAKAVQDFFAK